MNDRTTTDDRDDAVARAIRSMPVPEHLPGFWERLERALMAEPAPPVLLHATAGHDVSRGGEAELLPLLGAVEPPIESDARRAARRSRPLRWSLAAAAAVLAIGVIGVQAMGGDDPASVQQTSPSTTAPVSSVSTTAAAGPASTDAARAQQTLLSFIGALAEGRTSDAAALLGPRSAAYLAAQSGSVEAFLVEASEGVGSWAGSRDRRAFTVELASRSIVVVLDGTITPEGMTERRTQAFAMTKAESADAWFVDAWAFDPAVGGRLEVSTTPDAGGVHSLRSGEPFVVFAGAPGTVRFALEGVGPVDAAAQRQGTGWSATWTPSALVRGEERVLTVAFEASDGSIATAIALRVRIV